MKYKLLFLIIFTFSCNSQPIRKEINVGETIKIQATNFTDSNNNHTYKWTRPSGPNNNSSNYKIENDKMLFTPNKEGEYDIILLIESYDQTLLYEESFIFYAVKNEDITIQKQLNTKVPTKIIDNAIENNIEIKKDSQKEIIKKSSYTIQIASWPTIERAQIHQNELQNLGYDSYIEEYYMKNKKQTWWRVRVGHFIDKEKAELIKNDLTNVLKMELWIDYINN